MTQRIGEYQMTTPNLKILGAAYGPQDVTATVRSLVSNQELRVKADPQTLTSGKDPWYGVRKTFVVVYQYDDSPVYIGLVYDFETLIITPPSTPGTPSQSTCPTTLTILGAVYGLKPVTGQAQSIVVGGSFSAVANNETWGDGWPGNKKTFVVVYNYPGGGATLDVVREGDTLSFATPE